MGFFILNNIYGINTLIMKFKINEFEIKNILKKHKLLKEQVTDINDILDDSVPKTGKNYKTFIEYLNGNVELTDIVDKIVSVNKKSTDDTKSVKVVGVTGNDDDFYEKVLDEIGAEPTEENMKFFYAWRQAEGAQAAFNPFNTTHSKDGSTFYNCLKKKNNKCIAGVKNYESEDDGISATSKTITNGYYPCILNGLRNSIGAKKIAEKCLSNLEVWGTGGLIKKVLNSSTVNPPKITRTTVKTV